MAALILYAASAASHVASRWPAAPVTADADSLLAKLSTAIGLSADSLAAVGQRGRMLGDVGTPPSIDEIASFNIILFVSIALVLVFYFSAMALVNMEHMNDSLLYSKSKDA